MSRNIAQTSVCGLQSDDDLIWDMQMSPGIKFDSHLVNRLLL